MFEHEREQRKAELITIMNRWQQVSFYKKVTGAIEKCFDEKFECALHLSTDQLRANMEAEYNSVIRELVTVGVNNTDLTQYLDRLYVRCRLEHGVIYNDFSPDLTLFEKGESSIAIGHRFNWVGMSDNALTHLLNYLNDRLNSAR